jgi:ATP-dependent helicase/nuclease subunit A
MEKMLPDALAREQALDTSQSCIVQAPAGSGKTELLTLRYLKLLSLAAEPEEVLAITFTKKAASEMRDRIVSTLQWATQVVTTNIVPSKTFEKQRLEIALSVLNADQLHSWNLLKNPSRLRVQTIDSFCFYLASQLPILSRVGGNPVLSDDVTEVYELAIQNTLDKLNSADSLSDDIALLLRHLDNNVGKVEKLLFELLTKRDQWISHVLLIQSEFDQAQDYLRENLVELVEESLFKLSENLTPYSEAIAPLLRFSAQNTSKQTPLTEELELTTQLPDISVEALPQWAYLANLLLIQKPQWRSKVDVRNGFPPGASTDKEFKALCKKRKDEFTELVATLKQDDGLLEQLDYIRKLPYPDINTYQWQLLGSVARILIQLSGELLLAFAHFGVMDYTQAGAAARSALGSTDAPTDLALTLDHKIQHILVDEFQDTSQLQLEILQQLTLGWQQGDGRTLFLVGDAMQSCYGFRNANVGIYLNVQANGIGDVSLTPLLLQTNFRSQENVVAWVNKIFSGAFPSMPDSSRGAVPYAPSVPIHEAANGYGVNAILVSHDGSAKSQAKDREAELVVEHIETLQKTDPGASIAILVRSRSHLAQIIPRLKEAGINWQATDIDRLGTLPVIEDLLSLTRALANTSDRLAWFSVLRGPWCGLTSADLLAVAQHVGLQGVWQGLETFASTDAALIDNLSADGLMRLRPVVKVLAFAMASNRRVPLRHLVETTWTLLRGYDLVKNAAELDSAAHFFDLVEQFEVSQGIVDLMKFEEQVKQSFVASAKSSMGSNSINVLTMHKAKGLEYDHVILPGLTRQPVSDDKPLLQWYERLNGNGENKLFLAALTATGKDEDDLYKLIRSESKAKSLLEDTRLLYIAVTRAKTSALLIGVISDKGDGKQVFSTSSLLGRVWDQLDGANMLSNVTTVDASSAELHPVVTDKPVVTPLRRTESPLQLDQIETAAMDRLQLELETPIETERFPPEYDDRKAAEIGTVIHRCLEIYTLTGGSKQYLETIDAQKKYWALKLRDVIADESELSEALELVKQAVIGTIANPAFSWIFSPDNSTARSELQVTDARQKIKVIDRTLIDEQGVRWLIDFKTGTPRQGQSQESFIETMKARYRGQLENYHSLFAAMEENPIKMALLLTGINQLAVL